MIDIQKHIISEAFEQLSKSTKLKESLKGDLINLFKSKGYDIDKDAVKNYIDSAEEYIEMVREDDMRYSVEDWYKETSMNYPEDLKELRDSEDDTAEADWEDTTDVKFDESKLKESTLTEAPMDVKDYAAKLKARKAEKSQNPLEKINAQLDPDMEITDQLQVYFDELVPAQGKADTVAGELVRAMMRILYRDYNDGDLFYEGYGKETCGGSVVYLMDKVEDLERPFSNIVENQYEDQYYTSELEDAAYILIEYLNNHPELFIQKNEEDSRNVDENRLDEYFDIPLYEFEPDTSYDESYYAVSDDDIDDFVRGVVESDLSSGQVNRWARDGWTIVDLDREDYDTLQELWDRWFRDFLVDYERQEEDEYEDEEDFEESLNESDKPLSKMDINKLRDLAVSLGADKKKLYGTSKQGLIVIIDKLRKDN
ncbi:MAG: hypothetical protein J6Y28_04350 [Acholeplasmatales bacterium]|nr:hypothetical protein [Methanobrevibacter sp.]MBP5445385.1 hypothetical protein [Acholeplasmatales bacterium]